MLQFEFHAYAGDEFGSTASKAEVTIVPLHSDSAARSRAGRMAKRVNGPVDLARAGAAEWNDRYITTAKPCDIRQAGYRFERVS